MAHSKYNIYLDYRPGNWIWDYESPPNHRLGWTVVFLVANHTRSRFQSIRRIAQAMKPILLAGTGTRGSQPSYNSQLVHRDFQRSVISTSSYPLKSVTLCHWGNKAKLTHCFLWVIEPSSSYAGASNSLQMLGQMQTYCVIWFHDFPVRFSLYPPQGFLCDHCHILMVASKLLHIDKVFSELFLVTDCSSKAQIPHSIAPSSLFLLLSSPFSLDTKFFSTYLLLSRPFSSAFSLWCQCCMLHLLRSVKSLMQPEPFYDAIAVCYIFWVGW